MVRQISVQVAFVPPGKQADLRELQLAPDATVGDAIDRSAIAASHAEFDLSGAPVGIWGRKTTRASVLRDGDRIEIYRPLVVDPKIARARRASSAARLRDQKQEQGG